MTDPKEVITLLRLWCKQKRGRQSAIARHLGCTRSRVSKWVKGREFPLEENCERILEYLKEHSSDASMPTVKAFRAAMRETWYRRKVAKCAEQELKLAAMKDEIARLEAKLP
jgi:transcriptional regulator with XRE-family HTH domain